MDLNSLLGFFNVAKPIIEVAGMVIGGGVAGAGIFAFLFKKGIISIGDEIFIGTNRFINNINDEDLRVVARHVIRFVAKKMPTAENNTKLNAAIALLQKATPNLAVSDDAIKEVIQSEYDEKKAKYESI